MEAHAALVPELGRIGYVAEQPVVQLERRAELAAEQVHLGHRLESEPAILAGVEREPVLAQRFVVVALLPEREPEVEVGEGRALDRLRAPSARDGSPCARAHSSAACPGSKRSSERLACARAKRRIERDGALGGVARGLVLAHVAVHEGQEVVRVGVVGIARDRLAERGERRRR